MIGLLYSCDCLEDGIDLCGTTAFEASQSVHLGNPINHSTNAGFAYR